MHRKRFVPRLDSLENRMVLDGGNSTLITGAWDLLAALVITPGPGAATRLAEAVGAAGPAAAYDPFHPPVPMQ